MRRYLAFSSRANPSFRRTAFGGLLNSNVKPLSSAPNGRRCTSAERYDKIEHTQRGHFSRDAINAGESVSRGVQ
jgi:hypothetical protein